MYFGERCDESALVAIGVGIFVFELLRDRCNVGERLLQGHAVFEARDTVSPVAAAAEIAVAIGMESCPIFGGLRGNEMEVARKHANDGVGISVERDGLAENVGAAAVAFLPRRVAENRGARSGEQIFAGVRSHDRGWE